MKKYDISELEAELEGLSLLEKKSHLENVQNDIESEIEELETAKDEVEDLLSDVENQINEGYKSEIATALKGISSDVCMLLPDNTLDIEGL
jgi:peptidoglycan hydrolase CwlO-like protein